MYLKQKTTGTVSCGLVLENIPGKRKTAGGALLRLKFLENDLSRYYTSPIRGALNNDVVDNVLACMFPSLLF